MNFYHDDGRQGDLVDHYLKDKFNILLGDTQQRKATATFGMQGNMSVSSFAESDNSPGMPINRILD